MPVSALTATLALVFLCVAGYLFYRPPRWIFSALAKRSPALVYYAQTDRPLLALTIDDGPNRESTGEILAVLQKYQTPATFFLISSRVEGNEQIVRQIVQQGHEIGNHLKEEVPSARLQPAVFARELAQAHKTLSTFAEIRWFRPGSGWVTPQMLAEIQKFGYHCALGSVYPYDAQLESTWFSQQFVLANVFPGAILVLHDGGTRGRRTAAVLEYILPLLLNRGWQFVTLSRLVDMA